MIIGITGHRDSIANEDLIRQQISGATLIIHGGAKGFDQQVERIAHSLGIQTQCINPDYAANGRKAPLIRNRAIVDRCDKLLAFYDGRKTGGTYYTVKYAKSRNRPIFYAR